MTGATCCFGTLSAPCPEGLLLSCVREQELQALGDAVGTVSRGVHQDVIDALPNAKYTSRFSDAHPPNGESLVLIK